MESGVFPIPTKNITGEFDPGSGRMLAVCLTHASRTRFIFLGESLKERTAVADGCVTRKNLPFGEG